MQQLKTVVFALFLVAAAGCQKQDAFLATKPNIALSTPSTLQDLQLLLNDDGIFNTKDPGLGEISSDDYYVQDNGFTTLQPTERNAYTWAAKVYNPGADVPDWSGPYQQVYTANAVLDALAAIPVTSTQSAQAAQIKGSALFDRCWAFYNLLQIFTLPYDSASAGTDLGIPLRLTSDLNAKSTRVPEKDCYTQIIADLQAAIPLLPAQAAQKTLPSAAAATALLARIYLTMGSYALAFHYADTCLSLAGQLTDYNTLHPGSFSLSTSFLAEEIYHTISVPYVLNYTYYKSVVDPALYASYAADDLRKADFFIVSGGLPWFRGTYDQKTDNYTGIAADEVYLTRAECSARLGNTAAAMADLNKLLTARWATGTFTRYTAASPDDALRQILQERRQELLYRGLRWADLRRLGKDPRFATQLTRTVQGATYTLPPGSPRYALPIPDNEIEFSGIQQNQR